MTGQFPTIDQVFAEAGRLWEGREPSDLDEPRADVERDAMRHMDMTVTVGPFSLVFGNRNDAMNLKLHFHTAYVWMEYSVDVGHGYPSFKKTNDALRDRLRELCAEPFADATNEDVLAILYNEMRTFTHPSWAPYGGCYHLCGMRLDVVGVPDSIGHDDGATTYTIRERTKC